MTQRIDTEVFFFNAETDYLPYYKRFALTMPLEATTRELLAQVAERHHAFAYPETRLVFRINDTVCTGQERLSDVVERFGTELRIEPVQAYRSTHCLIINDDDFSQAYETLAPFCDEDDKAYFDSLYALHYASATSEFDKNYRGDAIIALADRLIRKLPDQADAIYRSVRDTVMACEYENRLFDPYDLQPALEALRAYEPQKTGLLTKLASRFPTREERVVVPTIDLSETHAALYLGAVDATDITALWEQTSLYPIAFGKATRRNGRTIVHNVPHLAYAKAATILLDALDSGAEVLVCADEADARYFIAHRRAIEKAAGREIPLRITSLSAVCRHDNADAA